MPSGVSRDLPTIVHLDADAFFVSCELALRPELRGRKCAVGGRERGIISSASYEARACGVYTPMPTRSALQVASQAGLKSVLFTPMGAGIGGMSDVRCARFMLEELTRAEAPGLERLGIACLGERTANCLFRSSISWHEICRNEFPRLLSLRRRRCCRCCRCCRYYIVARAFLFSEKILQILAILSADSTASEPPQVNTIESSPGPASAATWAVSASSGSLVKE